MSSTKPRINALTTPKAALSVAPGEKVNMGKNHFTKTGSWAATIISTLFLLTSTGNGNAFSYPTNSDKLVMSPLRFEAKIIAMNKKQISIHSKIYPSQMSKLLLDRLQDYRSVTNKTVQTVLRAIARYESTRDQQESQDTLNAKFSYPKTLRFIGLALPLTEGQLLIQHALLAKRGELLNAEKKSSEAIVAFQKDIRIIGPLANRYDIEKIQTFYDIASVYIENGKNQLAINSYELVLGYAWYTISDPRMQTLAKRLYLQAGRGIIELSRHNLKALQSLYFVPSTRDQLGPLLKKAIKEAKTEQTSKEASKKVGHRIKVR